MAENVKTLLDEVRDLRKDLFWQILRRDRLIFIEGRRLEEKYLRLFAVKECAIYDLNTELLLSELRRKLAAELVPSEEIELRLREKREERHNVWLAHLQHRNFMLQDERRLTEHWFERLHYYYGLCVRLLHPDLYPNANAKQRQMMLHITQAYAERNLPVLAIKPELLQLEELPLFRAEELSEAELLAECNRLQSALADNESLMKTVEHAHPYNLRYLLEDNAACAARQRELDELLAYLREKCRAIE